MATCATCNDTGVVQRPGNETFARGGPPHYSAGTRLCPRCQGASSINLTGDKTDPPQDAPSTGLPDEWNAGFNGA